MIRTRLRQCLAGTVGIVAAIGVVAAGPALAMDKKTKKEIRILEQCLAKWPKHPFPENLTDRDFKVLEGGVSIAGMGGAGITDNHQTDKPRLILVKPSVSILTATTYNLMNENGWYCIRGQVTVMGSSTINLACKARLKSSSGGATVLGKGEGKAGTTVLGKTTINRKCEGKPKQKQEQLEDIPPIDDKASDKNKT